MIIPRKRSKKTKKSAKKGRKRSYRTGPGVKKYVYGLKKGRLTYLGTTSKA